MLSTPPALSGRKGCRRSACEEWPSGGGGYGPATRFIRAIASVGGGQPHLSSVAVALALAGEPVIRLATFKVPAPMRTNGPNGQNSQKALRSFQAEHAKRSTYEQSCYFSLFR